jgi:hypothetical protein
LFSKTLLSAEIHAYHIDLPFQVITDGLTRYEEDLWNDSEYTSVSYNIFLTLFDFFVLFLDVYSCFSTQSYGSQSQYRTVSVITREQFEATIPSERHHNPAEPPPPPPPPRVQKVSALISTNRTKHRCRNCLPFASRLWEHSAYRSVVKSS